MDGREIARDLGLAENGGADRAAEARALWGWDLRPALVVEGPAPMARRGPGNEIWVTRVAYDAQTRDGGPSPWFAEHVVDAFREQFDELRARGAFRAPRVLVGVQLAEATPEGRAFPSRGRFARAARRAIDSHSAAVVMGEPDAIDWKRLADLVAPEERYDSADGVAGEVGSRVSRLVFTVTEFRVPAGRGIAERLGLPPRCAVDLPGVAGGLCGQACLAYALGTVDQRKKYTQPARAHTLAAAAAALAAEIGVPGEMTLGDFDTFVARYPHRPVVVMQDRRTVAYHARGDAPAGGAREVVYLLLHENHYYNILNIDSFTRATRGTRQVWCATCLGIVERWHACVDTCTGCRHVFADDDERATHMAGANGARCDRCNFDYRFAGCAAYHRCARYLCLGCREVMPLSRHPAGQRPHACGEVYCARCDLVEPPAAGGARPEHRCFIKCIAKYDPEVEPDVAPEDMSSDDEDAAEEDRVRQRPREPRAPTIWAFDIECTLDEGVRADGEPVTATHAIAVVVAARLYSDEVVTFRGERAEEEFLAWIDGFRRTTTLIAHNGASYDAFMLLAAARRRRLDLPSRLIMNGAKLMYMKYKKARVVDSMRHIAGSLEKAAKTFGLAIAKSYFPYRFFTPENRGYAGDVPPKEWFDPGKMSEERLYEFKKWYKARRGAYYRGLYGKGEKKPYVLEDECVLYCRQDVEILRAVLQRYRDSAILASGLDPLDSATIAGYAMRVFRANHMTPRTIPILNRTEYDFTRRGLFGGRTDARQVLRTWSPEDVADGRYAVDIDVHSMYPSVQRYDPLPVGAPWWGAPIEGAEACAAWLRALEPRGECAMVECEVSCPCDLYHPVLLERRDNRLVAALDITAGVFTSPELVLALDNGYEVRRITRALCSRTSTTLFASYIDKYYAAKARHAPDGPEPNDGAYALAKMVITALWGKFGQRDNGSETKLFTSDSTWNSAASAFNRGALSELTVHDVTDTSVLATAVHTDGEDLHLDATNVYLAAFVTARARVRLYAALSQLGERVLYHDTDSVIYERVPGEPDVSTGPALGEWGDEVGVPITEFVALGPKTYAFECRDAEGELCRDAKGKPLTRVRSKGFATGFTLAEYRGLAQAFLAGKAVPPLEQAKMQFVRTAPLAPTPGTMTTRYDVAKRLVVSLQKVVVVDATCTLPHGHLLTWPW